jgi:hypothetical protein
MRSEQSGLRRIGAYGRWGSLGVGGAALLLTVITALAPASSAYGPHTYTAPYAKTLTVANNDIFEVNGCAKGTSAAAHFKATTGIATWSGKDSAKSCGGPLGRAVTYSIALSQGTVESVIPIAAPSPVAGTHNISVNWVITASGNIALTKSGTCPAPTVNSAGYGYEDCVAEAINQVLADTWLVDLTNGSVTYSSNYFASDYVYNYTENFTDCYPTCYYYNYSAAYGAPYSGTTSWTGNISAWMVPSHKYAVVTYIGGDLVMEMQVYHGAASGYINMSTNGNHADLSSIVVT